MAEHISISPVPEMPYTSGGDDIGQTIVEASHHADFDLQDNDILCVASKAVSIAEDNVISLDDITASEKAREIHERVPRKDVRAIQAIIDATGDPSGDRLEVHDNYIGGWLPNGLFLTSAGVDKAGSTELIPLPHDPDASAATIGRTIFAATGVKVAIIITDSEGRPDKQGSAQIAIGVYGLPPLRSSEADDGNGKVKTSQETTCDMLAASAGLLMGQRGFNRPVVRIRGYDFEFDEGAAIEQALNGNTL